MFKVKIKFYLKGLKYFMNSISTGNTAPRFTLHSANGKEIKILEKEKASKKNVAGCGQRAGAKVHRTKKTGRRNGSIEPMIASFSRSRGVATHPNFALHYQQRSRSQGSLAAAVAGRPWLATA